MLVIPIPGTETLTIPDAPKIVVREYESRLAGLPGLTMLMDPATMTLTAPGVDADRVSGYRTRQFGTPDGVSKIAASTPLGGRPAIRLAARSSVIWQGGGQRGTQTVIAAVNLTATGYVVSLSGSFGIEVFGTSALRLSAPAGVAVPLSNFAAPVNTRMIVGYSVVEATREVCVFARKAGSGLVTQTEIMPNPTMTDEIARNENPESGRNGITQAGDWGMLAYFDRALHLPDNLETLEAAVQVFADYYGIV